MSGCQAKLFIIMNVKLLITTSLDSMEFVVLFIISCVASEHKLIQISRLSVQCVE